MAVILFGTSVCSRLINQDRVIIDLDAGSIKKTGTASTSYFRVLSKKITKFDDLRLLEFASSDAGQLIEFYSGDGGVE